MTVNVWTGEQAIVQYCDYAVVDVATDSTTVFTGECLLYGFFVNTVLSAHINIFKDNTTSVISTVASLAAGTSVVWPVGLHFTTSLIFDPDNSGTGNITIFYKKLMPPVASR